MPGTLLVFRVLRGISLGISGVLAIGLVVWTDRVLNAPFLVKMSIGAGLVLNGFAMQIVYRRGRARFIEQLHEADFELCIVCGYALRELPSEHRCPECGTPFEKTDLTRRWKNWEWARK